MSAIADGRGTHALHHPIRVFVFVASSVDMRMRTLTIMPMAVLTTMLTALLTTMV